MDLYDLTSNPGYQLQLLLRDIFPYDGNQRSTFLAGLDSAVKAEGELGKIVYDSCINYLVRRLIVTARHIKRYQVTAGYDSDIYPKLRTYLNSRTRIPSSKHEQIVTLLVQCVRNSERFPSKTALNNVRRKNDRCYICGTRIDLDCEAEVEHVWPRTLGGSSEEDNLVIACKKCNDAKRDLIDGSDFHFEEICLVTDEDDSSFLKELNWNYRVALWSKSGHKCEKCRKPAAHVGPLKFHRVEPDDIWHFLNVECYCDRDQP